MASKRKPKCLRRIEKFLLGPGGRPIPVYRNEDFHFTVKMLDSTEIPFESNNDLYRLEHLRYALHRSDKNSKGISVPARYMIFVYDGKIYTPRDNGDMRLYDIMMEDRDDIGPEGPVLWLCWLPDNCYVNASDGTFFVENMLEAKRRIYQANQADFDPITVRTYKNVLRWSDYSSSDTILSDDEMARLIPGHDDQ